MTTEIDKKPRGRPKKYQTEQEKLERYREVHKESCKKYWHETFKMAQMNEKLMNSNEKLILVSEKQLEEIINNILANKLKNIFSS